MKPSKTRVVHLWKPDVVGTTRVNGWKNRANKRTTNWKILHICINSSLVGNILWSVLAMKGNRNSTWVYVGLDDKTQWKTPLTYVTASSQQRQHVCSSRRKNNNLVVKCWIESVCGSLVLCVKAFPSYCNRDDQCNDGCNRHGESYYKSLFQWLEWCP